MNRRSCLTSDRGVQVQVGECGVFNKAPHPVALAWMEDCLCLWHEAGWGFALWNLRGSFGVMDSEREDLREDLQVRRLQGTQARPEDAGVAAEILSLRRVTGWANSIVEKIRSTNVSERNFRLLMLRVPALALTIFALCARTPGCTAPAAPSARSAEPRVLALDVRDFGATGDGASLDTAAIAKAIRAASRAGGGIGVFPPGVYLTGTLELLSNVTLEVRAGADIQGSKNVADYPSITDYGFGKTYGVNSTGEGDLVGIIVARHAENIGIIGQGVIDGSGEEFFDFQKPHYGMDFDPQYTRRGADSLKSMLETADGPVETKPSGRPGTMIVFSDCQNIVVRDLTFRNAPNWTFHLQKSRKAVISGLHILNSPHSFYMSGNDVPAKAKTEVQ